MRDLETAMYSAPILPAGPWTRLERFLTLGSEDGCYYAGGRDLTIGSAAAVRECLKTDGLGVVQTVVAVSREGRAANNDPALLALALASSANYADAQTNAAARAALSQVARTGTDLCAFAAFAGHVRGWGRGLRSAVAEWYLTKPAGQLLQQMLASRHREGWSHRDLLRLSHPTATTAAQNALFQWAVDGQAGHLATREMLDGELRQLRALELLKKAASEDEVVRVVEDCGVTEELLPAKWKTSARVWEALLDGMPCSSLIANLGEMTAAGLLEPVSAAAALVVARLIDRKRIANSRLHPIALLSALAAYKRGSGWSPVSNIVDALEEAYNLAFGNVEPTGKRIYVALDTDDFIKDVPCKGMPELTTAMASTAMAKLFAQGQPGELDPSVPFQDAIDRKLSVDAFVLITGRENWSGVERLVQGLEEYRSRTGIATRLVLIALTATERVIANPDDPGQIGVAGFDAAVPGVVSRFLSGHDNLRD